MDAGFYIAGGLGMLIALLSWGDQIRGAQETTRTLERELLQRHKLKWADLQPLIRKSGQTPEDRLKAVLRFLKDGGLTKTGNVKVLQVLESLNDLRERMEFRYAARYWIVFALAAQMFLSGATLMILPENIVLSIGPYYIDYWYASVTIGQLSATLWQILATVWAALVGAAMALTFIVTQDEERLRRGLSSFDDLMRQAEDAKAGVE